MVIVHIGWTPEHYSLSIFREFHTPLVVPQDNYHLIFQAYNFVSGLDCLNADSVLVEGESSKGG